MDFRKAVAGFYFERIVFEADNCANNFCSVFKLQLIGKCFERHKQQRSNDKENPEPHDLKYYSPPPEPQLSASGLYSNG